MKSILGILLTVIVFHSMVAQNLSKGFMYDGQNRTYRINIPSSYRDSVPVPLVIALHGMGDNANAFQSVGFNILADTANFIAVYPNALVDPTFMASGWNAGVGAFGLFVNPDVDDVGFLNALIDTVSENYSIDSTRIYATGFSIGGYMAERLACELNDRIAAIASVSGLIGNGVTCNPGRPVPVLHMHGTADSTITYSGSFNIPIVGPVKVGMSVDEMINFWLTNNNCTATPDTTALTQLGYQLEKINFGIGEDASELLFYKIFAFPHSWLASGSNLYATKQIWNFFTRHQLPAEPADTFTNAIMEISPEVKVYPNPFTENVSVSAANIIHSVEVFDMMGNSVARFEMENSGRKETHIIMPGLQQGIYLLHVHSTSGESVYRISKME